MGAKVSGVATSAAHTACESSIDALCLRDEGWTYEVYA